ncbi:hypothetical protein RIF29_12665 [Crotalaria pallida]|uniref:Uncharacterized protein n=1 Tax=Crotalaria pallida TaxID=3830 RepID=A0AAN9INE4_CROPI
MFVTFSTPIAGSRFPDLFATKLGERRTVTALSRKLEENENGIGSNDEDGTGFADLDDYIPVKPMPPDPKEYVSGGTIEHDQPVGPYIPKPTPPPAG